MENQTDNKEKKLEIAKPGVISKETLLKEIEGSKKAIESMRDSIEINKVVLEAFEAKLKELYS